MRIRTPDRPRSLFLVLIVLGHAVAICVLVARTAVVPTVRENEITALPILLLPLPEPARQPERSIAPANRSRPRPILPQPETSPENTANPASIATAPDTVAPLTDWANEARQVARQRAEATQEYRQFGEAPHDDAPHEPVPVDPFKTAHHAGEIEELGDGIERRWISPLCYREFGRPPDLLPPPGPRIKKPDMIHCMVGPESADGKLFDHLKPRYLKPGK